MTIQPEATRVVVDAEAPVAAGAAQPDRKTDRPPWLLKVEAARAAKTAKRKGGDGQPPPPHPRPKGRKGKLRKGSSVPAA